MGFYGKNNNAAGKDPDSGAIFMTSSETKRECFRRGVFGLPASYIQFVEKVKAGMILFLFHHEKRQLHGVFQADCDGAINIEPNAFTSSGNHYPAQVKFIPIWSCKPLSESEFRSSIRENYFSTKKFNFGLSEKQVFDLVRLFSTRKLDLDIHGRHLTKVEDFKSEWYPIGKVGRSVVHGMVGESVQNEQVVGDNSSHVLMHKYKRDYLQYDGEDEYTGLYADDMGLSKQGRSADIEVDATGRYVSDYLPLNDERRFTAREDEHYLDRHAARFTSHENNDYMDSYLRPYINDGYSKIPSDKIRDHIDGRSSIPDRLMAEDLRKTDQRMVFSDDIPGLSDSNVNLPVFYRKPLERNFLAQNHLSPTSAMSHPFQTQITKTSCAIQGITDSILYNGDAPGLNSRQLPVGVNDGSEPIIESTSLSTQYRRNSLNKHMELKDMDQWHDIGGGFPNAVMYSRNKDYMPFNEARNSDQLGSESVLYESGNIIPSLRSPISPDLGNSGRVHETLPSFFHNGKSYLGNNAHPMTFPENLSHEITLQNNNETYNPDVPRANEGHSQVQYDDSFDHRYDIGCYGYSRNSNCSHPKKKSSVFSRISFMPDVDKQEKGNNVQSVEYDYHAAVADVMNMARQSHSQWMTKRKPKPSQRNKAESLKDENPRPSQRSKAESLMDETPRPSLRNKAEHNKAESLMVETPRPSQRNKAESLKDEAPRSSQRNKSESLIKDEAPRSSQHNKAESSREKNSSSSQRNKAKSLKDKTQIEKPLEVPSMDFTAASGGNSNTTAEEKCYVGFKRRSEVRKPCDVIERNSNESKKSDSLVPVQQQKRRKLIRPNFNKTTSLDDKGINLSASLNLQVPLSDGNNNLKGVSGSCCILDQTKSIVKTVAEVQNITGPTHSEGKNSSHAVGYICDEGGEKANNEPLPALKDVPECRENINHGKILSITSCKKESGHTKDGSSVADNLKSVSLKMEPLHSTSQEHSADKIICVDKVINTDEEMPKDCGFSVSVEVKDGSQYIENSGNEKVSIETSCHIKEGLCVTHSVESASPATKSVHSTCEEQHLDKIICAGKGIIGTEKGMSKDGNVSSTTEVKDGSASLKQYGNDNAPIATCEQKMA